MEETEAGNQSSFLLHKQSLGNPDPHFLMQQYKNSKLGSVASVDESGPMTPQLAEAHANPAFSQHVSVHAGEPPAILRQEGSGHPPRHTNQVHFYPSETEQQAE